MTDQAPNTELERWNGRFAAEEFLFGTRPNALRESFAGLEILHLASHDDMVDEGRGHSGMSALIDLIARRRS